MTDVEMHVGELRLREASKRECMHACGEWRNASDQRKAPRTELAEAEAGFARHWLKNRSRRDRWTACDGLATTVRPGSARPGSGPARSPMTNAKPSIRRAWANRSERRVPPPQSTDRFLDDWCIPASISIIVIIIITPTSAAATAKRIILFHQHQSTEILNPYSTKYTCLFIITSTIFILRWIKLLAIITDYWLR